MSWRTGTAPTTSFSLAKGVNIAAHRQEDQEVMMLALHSVTKRHGVYQYVDDSARAKRKAWMGRMTAEDFRGLMPLLYGHLSPYGTFVLDMTSRLDIEPPGVPIPDRRRGET